MGKVGSTAVHAALDAAGIPTVTVHSLRRESLIPLARDFLERGEFPPRHVSLSMVHRERFVAHTEGGSIAFLSGVRDPLERTLSAFFQTLHQRRDGLTHDSDPDLLWQTYLTETDQFYGIEHWFGQEFGEQLGLDVYSVPFDRDRRIGPLPGGRGLIFRNDCAHGIKEAEIGALFGRTLDIGQSNVGARKSYASAYAAVRARARFPVDLVERVYASRFVRQFWTETEAGHLARQWRG